MSDIIPSFVTTDMNEFNLKRVCVCVRAYTESQILCFVLPFISHRADEKKKKKKAKKAFRVSLFF